MASKAELLRKSLQLITPFENDIKDKSTCTSPVMPPRLPDVDLACGDEVATVFGENVAS
jgi:hypothetical protein